MGTCCRFRSLSVAALLGATVLVASPRLGFLSLTATGAQGGEHGLGTRVGEQGVALLEAEPPARSQALPAAGVMSVCAALLGATLLVGRGTLQASEGARAASVVRRAESMGPFDPAKEIGAMAPLGFFDPAGCSKSGDKARFNNLRASEIKHGRVAMMAALGAVVQHYLKFPGFEDVPTGLGAVTTPPGNFGFAALFLVSGLVELAIWTEDGKKEPGNFGDPLGLGIYDADMRAREINNGRFAMFSAVAADALTGKDGVAQLRF